MTRDEQPIVVEQNFEVSREVLWRAITQKDQMVQWFFDNIPEFEAAVGFETSFNIHNDGRDFLHLWTVTKVIEHQLIEVRWRYEGYSGEALVSFELIEDELMTQFKLTHTVTECFPQDIPEFRRQAGVQGWQFFINEQLSAFIQKGRL